MNQPSDTTGSPTDTGQVAAPRANGQFSTRTDPPPEMRASASPVFGQAPDDGLDERPRRPSLTMRQAGRLALIAVTVVVLGGVVSLVVALLLPKQYAARTELLFTITTEEPTQFLREDRTLTTQLVLIEGRSVLEPVAAAFGLTVDELSEHVTAQVVTGSKIIQIEVRDGSRERGLRLLAAISEKYLETLGTGENASAREFLERQLADVRRQMTDAPAGELPALAAQEQALNSQLIAVELERFTGPRASVVVPPYSVTDPVSPRLLLAAATGALTALLVASGVVAFLARRWMRG